MKHHQNTIGKSDSYGTPHWITDPLGRFDLDPCGMKGHAVANVTSTIYLPQDGLKSDDWGDGRKRVWLNPPFNRYERPKWMRRMAEHDNGIMLVPAACETAAFYDWVWGVAAGVLMLKGRPHFIDAGGKLMAANSGCTICLVAYGRANLEALLASNLGVVVRPV